MLLVYVLKPTGHGAEHNCGGLAGVRGVQVSARAPDGELAVVVEIDLGDRRLVLI